MIEVWIEIETWMWKKCTVLKSCENAGLVKTHLNNQNSIPT
jgi:hypothetical protein